LSEDIYEPEFHNSLSMEILPSDNAFDWITQSSKVQQSIELERQIVIANSSNQEKKLKTMSFFKNNPLFLKMTDEMLLLNKEEINSRRKSSLESGDCQDIVPINKILDKIQSFDFNVFELNDLVEKRTLEFISNEIFERGNFFEEMIDEKKFKNFIREISNGYDRAVVYHNDLHACDVLQTCYVMISKGNLVENLSLNEIDIVAAYLSAICHDYKHNGFNNMFHVNDKTSIAITYNDSSVLENFHVAESFKVLLKPENNLLCKLQKEEWRLVRRRMIDCILMTDMANHAKHLSGLKAKLETFDVKGGNNVNKMIFPDNAAKTYENQQLILGMCLHTADVSNPAKPLNINIKWVDLVFLEFFNQGDCEKKKGLPVSLLCDRETTNVNKSQIGFINFVVLPTFDTMMNVIPQISQYYEIIKSNLKRYEELYNEQQKKI